MQKRGRPNKIWLRSSDGKYYTTIDGKQIWLGDTFEQAQFNFNTLLNGSSSNFVETIRKLKKISLEVGGWTALKELISELER